MIGTALHILILKKTFIPQCSVNQESPAFRHGQCQYLNPLIGMCNKGISLDCYVHFRDILKHKLSERAIKNLDRHIVDEYATSPNILVDGACPTEK